MGLCLALQKLLRVLAGGLFYSGLPCSSQVWISRGSSGRAPEDPRGNVDSGFTQKGNVQACRYAMLVIGPASALHGVSVEPQPPECGTGCWSASSPVARLQYWSSVATPFECVSAKPTKLDGPAGCWLHEAHDALWQLAAGLHLPCRCRQAGASENTLSC